jgi:MFS family permease
MSQVKGAAMLVVAVFLLRQTGQGLMSHTAITSMARYYHRERGRAIAIASLGFAVGEAALPVAAVLAIAAIGWRWSYAGIAILLAVGLIPVAFTLLAGHPERHRAHLARMATAGELGVHAGSSWNRAQVLRDLRFYLVLPAVLAPPTVVTAMFFHHLNIADLKGWSHAWMTSSYVVYAVAVVIVSLGCGQVIDRVGALRVVPFMLAPLAVALGTVALFTSPWIAWPYLFLLGVSVGIAHTAVSAMWAEIYGVLHLGAIKSMIAAFSVFGSALGPVIMGGLMDLGASADQVCWLFAAYALLAAGLLTIGLRRT